MPLQWPFFSKTVTLIFHLDLDFGTKERVLPPKKYIYVKNKSSITYNSKALANVKVFTDKQNRQMDKQTGQNLYIPDRIKEL